MDYNNFSKDIGSLQLFMGPMFSGKSLKLVSIYDKLKFLKIPTYVINYIDDKRYSDDSLKTHNSQHIPCVFVRNLSEVNDDSLFTNAVVVLVNEGQFFQDLLPWTQQNVDYNKKHIIISGLDADYKRNKFGTIIDLIPIADQYTKLTAFCVCCKDGTPAIHTYRTNTQTEQVLIGCDDMYEPLCRKCYLNKINS